MQIQQQSIVIIVELNLTHGDYKDGSETDPKRAFYVRIIALLFQLIHIHYLGSKQCQKFTEDSQ